MIRHSVSRMNVKILHITKMKGISGSENHLFTLLSGLHKQHFTVELCILVEQVHVELLQEIKQTLALQGVTVSMLIIPKYGSIQLILKLRNYIIQERFDIVHTHLIHADIYGTLAAKLAKVPVILSSRHNDDRFRRHILLIWLNRLLAHWHTNVIVISDWVGQFLREVEKIPPEKIVRIHYGLEAAPILEQADASYVRKKFHIPDEAPVIGTIGRLTEQKGHRYLLEAVKEILPEFPELRVLLVGDGELREELEALVEDLGLTNTIIFAGYRSDAIKLLSGFDFFVFPSLWEGFGLVLLEAMALKKAIVASNVSAIPESVRDGETGVLVPDQQAGALAEAMRTLLSQPDLAREMGASGYARLIDEFSVVKMVNSTMSLYHSMLQQL